MPWEIKEHNGQQCVFKKGASAPIKGGCHPNREKAVAHLRALHANEAMSQPFHLIHVFSDQDKKSIKAGEPVWVHAAPFGTTKHPVYGDVTLDQQKFDRMVGNFKGNVVGTDLPIRYEHFGMDKAKGHKAAGWVKDMKVEEDSGLWYLVDFTPQGAQEVSDGEWRYFSFEYEDLFENSSNEMFLDVSKGGALTNDPYWGNMVPLNFSSLVREHPDILDEHADIEHSEPGTGSPPERRTDNDIPEDDMYRRDTPPIVKELEQQEEGSMEEFLKELKAALGLKEDASETEVAEAYAENMTKVASSLGIQINKDEPIVFSTVVAQADTVNAELEPLRKAAKDATTRNAFREQYPEEYDRMRKLEETDVDNKAKAFSSRYERFPALDKDNKPTSEKSTRGFSALVLEDIEEAHRSIATKAFSHSDLEKLLDHIGGNGIVDYSEKGSARERETRRVPTTGSTGGNDDRQAFSALVQEVMEEDQLDYSAAIKEAAKRDPELFEAYRVSPNVAN